MSFFFKLNEFDFHPLIWIKTNQKFISNWLNGFKSTIFKISRTDLCKEDVKCSEKFYYFSRGWNQNISHIPWTRLYSRNSSIEIDNLKSNLQINLKFYCRIITIGYFHGLHRKWWPYLTSLSTEPVCLRSFDHCIEW